MFKVGQKVRSVPSKTLMHTCWNIELVVTKIRDGGCLYDCTPITAAPYVAEGLYFHHELVPLTDPKADEFIERIKKLGREPAPVREAA